MRYEIKLPCHRLKPYVKHLVISEADHEQTYRVLPDTGIVIGFQYSGKLSYLQEAQIQPLASSGITGLLDSYRTFQNTAQTGSVLVVFTEIGAAHFLNIPVHELFRESLSLEHFFSRQEINELEERLMAAGGDEERIALVEQFLLNHLNDRPQDLLVDRTLHDIHQSRGTVRISKLAMALNTSQSPLEKRFRSMVGASPKKFAGIVRARHMLAALEQGQLGLADHLYSYYDQAHFIKDFKKFTSLTPEQYLKVIRRNSIMK